MQENLASNHDIVDFVKKDDFDDKLKSLSKKVALIRKHVVLQSEFNKLSEKVKLIWTKGLINDW